MSFKKKFKVRVKHFYGDKYTVQYAYYRLFPNWTELLFWLSPPFTSNLECWSTKMFNVKDAEELAKSLKSIEDIDKYYECDRERCINYKKTKQEYLKENVPYESKEF